MLTQAQKVTLKAAILADATALPLWTAGDFPSLTVYVNAPTAQDAWRVSVPAADMVSALKFATYDGIIAGKRDAFRLMLEFGPADASKASVRSGLADIFATGGSYTDTAQLGKMLTEACVEKALWAETKLGFTTPAAVGGVTAIKRTFVGTVSIDELSALQGV